MPPAQRSGASTTSCTPSRRRPRLPRPLRRSLRHRATPCSPTAAATSTASSGLRPYLATPRNRATTQRLARLCCALRPAAVAAVALEEHFPVDDPIAEALRAWQLERVQSLR